MEHHDSSQHSHTNQHSRAPYFPAYSGPSLSPKPCELVLQSPSRRDPANQHTTTTCKRETQEDRAKHEGPGSPDTELSRGTPSPLNHGQASRTVRAHVPPTYLDASIPTAHAEEHHPVPHASTHLHPGDTTGHILGYPGVMVFTHTKTHPCKPKALTIQTHKQGPKL